MDKKTILYHFLFVLLLPMSVLYFIVTWIRNTCYDWGIFKSYSYPVPIICVGNLNVGGSGKTPHVEWLIRQYQDKKTVAVLSRGYGRKTKGLFEADASSDAAQIGDEPLQYFLKFGHKIRVVVCENRNIGIQYLLHSENKPELIILDDAYQHRSVKAQINILLTDYSKPFWKDWVLPSGRLREGLYGANRADMVIVTKCNSILTDEIKKGYIKNIEKWTKVNTPVYFSHIEYGVLSDLTDKPVILKPKDKCFILSGIANSNTFENYIEANYSVIGKKIFPDHYVYTEQDLIFFENVLKENPSIKFITTEKDMVKLRNSKFSTIAAHLYYQPIQIILDRSDLHLI